jgi:hypothetical protein
MGGGAQKAFILLLSLFHMLGKVVHLVMTGPVLWLGVKTSAHYIAFFGKPFVFVYQSISFIKKVAN